MDCEKFDQVAMSALYGELDELTSAAAKRHAETCPHCQTTWSGLNATRKLGVLPVVALPVGFEQRILHAAREAQRHLPWPRRVSRAISWAGSYAMRPQTAMAAILLLMLGSSVIFVRVKPDRTSTPSRVRVTERGVPEQATEEVRPAPPVSPEMRAAAPRSARREEERGGAPGTFAASPPAREAPAAEPKEKAERSGELAAANTPAAAGAAANEESVREGASGRALAPDEATRDDALARSAAAAPVAQAAAAPKDAYAAAMDLYTAGRYAEAERAFTDVAAAGNRNAASASLYAGKSAEAGVGCSRAAVKYELTASRYGATTPGAEALWAAANCYKANGNLDKARQLYLALRSVAGYRDRAEGELASLAAQRQQQIASRARAGARSSTGVQGSAASAPAGAAAVGAAPAAPATKPAP